MVPATDVFDAIMVTAQRLNSTRVICGLSNKLTADEQAKHTGDAWERMPEPRPRLSLQVCAPDGAVREYALGPHNPPLRPQDVELISSGSVKGARRNERIPAKETPTRRELRGHGLHPYRKLCERPSQTACRSIFTASASAFLAT